MREKGWMAIVVGLVVIGIGWLAVGDVKAIEQVSELFISEYVEGSSNNKALEIYNPSGSVINLEGYKVERYTNGAVTVSGTLVLPSVELSINGTYVVCHPDFNVGDVNKCNLTSSILNFNGDDAIVLKNSIGEILDVIGQVGNDPGTEWINGEITTLDKTLIRKCSVSYGDLIGDDIFDPAVEWTSLEVNNFTNLGIHTTCFMPLITPTLIPMPTILPTEIPTPTTTIVPSPTPTEMVLPTPSPTTEPTPIPTIFEPSPTLIPSPTETEVVPTITIVPTEKPIQNHPDFNWKRWVCEKKTFTIKWGKRFKEISIPVCHWNRPWFDNRFYPLHKHY